MAVLLAQYDTVERGRKNKTHSGMSGGNEEEKHAFLLESYREVLENKMETMKCTP